MPIISHSQSHSISRRSLLGGLLAAGAGGMLGVHPALSAELKKAKRRLLIVNQAGGLSQFESWDPKPNTDTGGPTLTIPTSVPGVHVADMLPHTSQQMQHLLVLRGMSTGDNNHGPAQTLMLTGRREGTGLTYPEIGCVVNYHLTPHDLPVPGFVSTGYRNGAAFLGPRYDAVLVNAGTPPKDLERPATLAEAADLRRNELRTRLNARFSQTRKSAETSAYTTVFEQAAQLMRNKPLFDLAQEPAADHERYGKHPFGQSCLLARRLLDHGVTCVRVDHNGYDTHAENFNVHLDLLEQFDRTFAALVADLAARGHLADTVLLCTGEFGRTPQINGRMGRDHWSHTWSLALGGAGVPVGGVYGATNDNGTDVVAGKVSAPEMFHTLLTLLGIDPLAKYDVGGEPIPVGDPAARAIEAIVG